MMRSLEDIADDRQAAAHEGAPLSDDAWAQIAALLPRPKRKSRKGRPRTGDREVMVAILYRLRTGCPWKALPRRLGVPSTIYDRFQEWRAAGVFEAMLRDGLLQPEEFEHV